MKKTAVLLIMIIFIVAAKAQRTEYHARIYDGVSFVPVAGANIFNVTSGNYTFSDEEGKFQIFIKEQDTLIISKSIYRQMIVVITDEIIRRGGEDFFLYYKAILLKEINVISLNPSYEGFKRDFSNIQLPEIYRHIGGSELSEWEKKNLEYKNEGPNVFRNTAIASPITYLYEKFSKKAKMKQLYREMIEYEEEIDKVPTKYNREIVAQLTGLEGEALMEFMMYCRFSYYDIIRMSPQEIIGQIKIKFTEYEYYKIQGEKQQKK